MNTIVNKQAKHGLGQAAQSQITVLPWRKTYADPKIRPPGDSLGGIVAAEDFLRRCELLQQLSWERWEVRSTIWL